MINEHDEDHYPLSKVRETLEGLPHFRELNLLFTDLTRGSATLRVEYSPRLVGNPDTGALHGGVITTLMDSVSGAAAFSVVKVGQTVATLDLRIDYLTMAAPQQPIFGRAEVVRAAKNVVFVKGFAYCDQNEPMAHSIATFMVGSVGFSI